MADILNEFGINFRLLAIQVIGFLILLWLMKKFLWSRILEMVQGRTAEIRGAYEQNEKLRDELTALKSEYELKVQHARAEAESIVNKAVEQAELEGRGVIEKTRKEAEQVRLRGLADIEQEKKRAIVEIRTEVVNLSVEIAARLLARQIDDADAARLTDEVISEIGGMRQ